MNRPPPRPSPKGEGEKSPLPLGRPQDSGRGGGAGGEGHFLVLDKLTKRFGDHLAVDSLSLAFEKGEFVSLLGPSGCGKTTTLQMIAGFVEATSGAVTLEGRDLLAMKPAQRGLGIVFQSYALFPHLTA